MSCPRWVAAVALVCTCLSPFPTRGDDGKAVALLPNHAVVTIDGDVIGADPNAPRLKTADAQAARPTGNPYLLPALGLKAAVDHRAEITSSLDDLFDNWVGARAKFGTFLVLLPAKVDIKGAAAEDLRREPSGTNLLLRPYPLHDREAAVVAVVPRSIGDAGPFGVSPRRSEGRASAAELGADAVFVRLDGFGARVPVAVANLLETNFINGFVTRLALGSYVAFWEASAGTRPGAIALSLGAMVPHPGALDLFTRPDTYPPGSTMADDVAAVLGRQPIDAMGIMWGWHAADELVAFDRTPDHRYIRDAWRLIGYRFSSRGIGDVVAFTLNYLAGGSQNEHIRALAAGRDAPAIGGGSDIYAAMTRGDVLAKAFTVGLEDIMFAEIFAIMSNDDPAFDTGRKRRLVTEYADFLTGYRKGESRTADAFYKEAGALTFGAGYPTGMLDAYSLGLSEALRDPHAADYADNWRQADAVVTSLQKQVSALEAELRMASVSGGTGFWQRLGTMSDPRGSFIGAITEGN